ncbi:MAG: hypothetical protein ABI612_13700 [Betaproteobacteria bacterium]
MKTPAFTSFAESLDRFLDLGRAEQFATGQWLAWLPSDHLFRLASLISLALEHNNEDAWDDLALTVMMADGAESAHNHLDWTGHQIVERVTLLRVIASLEVLRREGIAQFKEQLTIQPERVVAATSTRKYQSGVADISH